MKRRIKIKMKDMWNIKKPMDRKKMNWAEAKWANPRLKPMGDWDNDGVKNQFDCRPMNRKKQHVNTSSDSKWKTTMIDDFATIGDLRKFAGEDKDGDKY